jgi:hypothetical protein
VAHRPLLEEVRALTEIAGYIGRAACAAIGSFVRQCYTGESVAFIGYATAVLVFFGCGLAAFLGRPR